MFRLALALGRTVDELERTLSSSELVEWIAFYEIEPFGTWRDNYHAAMQAALLANINRKKGAPAIKTSEFMYKDRDTQRQNETMCFLKGLDMVAKKDG